ncbi:hypothetical protein AYO44_03810 [Planctomycetaceae bacterium SCGC AG-212-F19]|nr:hypothetical protein AYO44_03810 [Planctomycetaceae bacterium SCGC AG-212-F19]
MNYSPEMAEALHQAGHALTVICGGGTVDELTIMRCTWPDLADSVDELCAIVAGPAATEFFCPDDSDPWGEQSGDTDAADYHRVRAGMADAEVQKATKIAEQTINREAGIVHAIAAELVLRGQLTHEELVAVVEGKPGARQASAA